MLKAYHPKDVYLRNTHLNTKATFNQRDLRLEKVAQNIENLLEIYIYIYIYNLNINNILKITTLYYLYRC